MLCIAILARDADGVVRPEETEFIRSALKPQLARMRGEDEMATVALLARSLRSDGMASTLRTLRDALGGPEQCRDAVRFAFEVALADQDLDPRETEHVERMGEHFGLAEHELAAILTRGGRQGLHEGAPVQKSGP